MRLASRILRLAFVGAALIIPLVESDSRIVGGDEATVGDYPYYVEMGGCGGAIIAPDIVLLAAHCTDSFVNKQLTIGSYTSHSTIEGGQGRFCDIFIAHPNYSEKPVPKYDFALCKLDRPVEIDESRVKLVLNEEDNVPALGDNLRVMGFGKIRNDRDEGLQKKLRDVEVPYVTDSECGKSYRYGTRFDRTTMLCAGFIDVGGKDACQGDSGGPIVKRISNGDGSFTDLHVGVVSWGYGCAASQYPGVYARTSYANDWIFQTMCEDLKSVDPRCGNTPEPCDGAEVIVNLTTDSNGGETSYYIVEDNRAIKYRKFAMSNTATINKMCLPYDRRYRLQLNDKEGDGMCSGKCGSYSIVVDGEMVVNGDPNFKGNYKLEDFSTPPKPSDVATARPTPSPTRIPTAIPTREPKTSSPTRIPTASPTREPKTSSPTRIPTASPTREPKDIDGEPIIADPTLPPTPNEEPNPTPNRCTGIRDIRRFKRNNQNCKKYVRGSKGMMRKKCNIIHRGRSIKGYWCHKTCSKRILGANRCYTRDSQKKNRNGDNVFEPSKRTPNRRKLKKN